MRRQRDYKGRNPVLCTGASRKQMLTGHKKKSDLQIIRQLDSLSRNLIWHTLHYSLWTDIAGLRSKSRGRTHTDTHSHSLLCLLMLSAAMPPCGAAGYIEGMLVVMKSAICCRANRLVGVLPFFSWSWIIVSSSSQNACRSTITTTHTHTKNTKKCKSKKKQNV